MELIQVYWSDQNKLFVEFKKNEEEINFFAINKIKKLKTQFEVYPEGCFTKIEPELISIRSIYQSNSRLGFDIELDDLHFNNDLNIKLIYLIIELKNEEKHEFRIGEVFNISDIWENEDCYVGYEVEHLFNGKNKTICTRRRVIQKTQRDMNSNREESIIIFEDEKLEINSNGRSQNINKNILNQSFFELMKEHGETLKSISRYLEDFSSNIQKLPNPSHEQQSNLRTGVNQEGIERIKRPLPLSTIHPTGGSPSKIQVIKEMETKFKKCYDENKGFNIKDILTPMSDEELEKTLLCDEELQEREEKMVKKLKERERSKSNEKQIEIEDLKPPHHSYPKHPPKAPSKDKAQ